MSLSVWARTTALAAAYCAKRMDVWGNLENFETERYWDYNAERPMSLDKPCTGAPMLPQNLKIRLWDLHGDHLNKPIKYVPEPTYSLCGLTSISSLDMAEKRYGKSESIGHVLDVDRLPTIATTRRSSGDAGDDIAASSSTHIPEEQK